MGLVDLELKPPVVGASHTANLTGLQGLPEIRKYEVPWVHIITPNHSPTHYAAVVSTMALWNTIVVGPAFDCP